MSRTASLVIVTLLAVPAQAQSLDEIVDRVQKVYVDTRNFRAEFSQVLTLRATKRKRRASGRVYFQKPSQFRFEYTRGGDRKVVVSDGRKVWTFVPEDRQVRIDPFNPKLASSLRFLWGEGNLREQFDVKKIDEPGLGRPGDHVLELVPKADEGHFKKVRFVIDPTSFAVRETVVYDPVGNINHMTFTKVKRNLPLAAKRFRFKIPKGVETIRSPELKEAGD